MHEGGARIKRAYLERRRVFHPKYHPDSRTEAMWDSIAEYAYRNNCPDLEMYVEAAFVQLPRGRPPFPNMLKSAWAVTWYKRHMGQKIAAEDPAIVNQAEYAGEEVQVMDYRLDWIQDELYVHQQHATGKAIQKIIMDENIPLAPYFRIVYSSIFSKSQDPELRTCGYEIWKRYHDRARQMVRSCPHLHKFLTEKGIDVGRLF